VKPVKKMVNSGTRGRRSLRVTKFMGRID